MAVKLHEAGVRVGRVRHGALLEQPEPDVGGGVFCPHRGRVVKPAVRKFWGRAALLVATAQLVAVIVSVVACFTAVDPWKGLRRWFVAWPAAIHPVGLGVAAAVVAALAAAWLADVLNERAEQTGSCPRCRNTQAQSRQAH